MSNMCTAMGSEQNKVSRGKTSLMLEGGVYEDLWLNTLFSF